MGLLNFLKPTDSGKIIDDATSAVDKLFFTNEERADYLQKAAQVQLDFQKATASESTVRSVTRRVLAIMMYAVFLGLVIATAVTGFFDVEKAKFLFSLVGQLFSLAMAVTVFYFGGYYLPGMFRKKEKDKSKS